MNNLEQAAIDTAWMINDLFFQYLESKSIENPDELTKNKRGRPERAWDVAQYYVFHSEEYKQNLEEIEEKFYKIAKNQDELTHDILLALFHYLSNEELPSDFLELEEIVKQLVDHTVDHYSKEEDSHDN